MDSTTKRKFVLWLAMERERRQKAEQTLSAASEALAHSEHTAKQWQTVAQTAQMHASQQQQQQQKPQRSSQSAADLMDDERLSATASTSSARRSDRIGSDRVGFEHSAGGAEGR
eukprot:3929482-Pyramimonas_sp.AAC.1